MSYCASTKIEVPEIQNVVYYGKRWYMILQDVDSSPTLSVEKVFVDDGLNRIIQAGTNASDHKRIFPLAKQYDPNLCHTAYIVLYDAQNKIVSKGKEVYFGNRSNCKDTIKPNITLRGDNPSTIHLGEYYHEQGATASDNIDGDISQKITIDSSNLNINVAGSYSIYYSVQDSAQNTTTVSREVKVIQSNPNQTVEIKKIVYYGKKWYMVLQDVAKSPTLSVEQVFVDDGLNRTINAGTSASDHKRVFPLTQQFDPNLCHTAYIVLYDTHNNSVSQSNEIQFGNISNCENNNTVVINPNSSNYYISLTGNDSNNGKSLKTAFKTISHALSVAKRGDTILMKGGVYRQSNILYSKRDQSNKYITLQNYNGEKVVIKGSKVVTSWEHYKDNIWKLVAGGTSGLNRKVHYQQVFYADGKSLQKVGYPNYIKQGGNYIWKSPYKRYVPIKENSSNPFGMSEGTFYVQKLSDGTYDLYVWLPNGKTPIDSDVTMEVSDAKFILYAYDVDRFKIKGLTFMHTSSAGFGNFNNGFQGGVGVAIGRYGIVEDCEIAYMDFAGLSLSLGNSGHKAENMHQTIIHSKIHHNGAVGISSITGGFLIVENEFYENGHRPFIQYWHTGAIKTSAGGWGKILDNYIHDEKAEGIWFDSCHTNTTHQIVVSRNYLDGIGHRNNPLDQIHERGHAIFMEQSSNILIDNNIVNRAITRGIYISLSKNVQVINNLVRASRIEQLGVRYRDDLGLKLSNVSITDNIFLDKLPNQYMDVKAFYESDKDAIFNPNNIFKNNIIYNSNGIYKADFSTSHWSFDDNLKGIDPLLLTHGNSRLDEWTIDSNSPVINASVSGKHLKYDFRRLNRNTTRPMNMGPFEEINNADYTTYVNTHKKFNTYK